MPIEHALCCSYKREILSGVHRATDTYKIALYTSDASLGERTTTYTPTDEVVGQGYTAGGAALSGMTTGSSGQVAWADWNSDPTWPNSTITARGALIYNLSQGGRAVAVIDLGKDRVSSGGEFTIVLPQPTADMALIRIE